MSLRIASAFTEVSIATHYGNCAFSMKVRGREILWHPRAEELARGERARDPHPDMGGIPLTAPWANRIDSNGFEANGRRYQFNHSLGSIWHEAAGYPIHGVILFTDRWQVIEQSESSVTSRLEFWRVPDWMAQFPFAHTLEVTHRIVDGALAIETAVENQSSDPMPLGLGWHPYFARPANATLQIAAREHAVMRPDHMPAGHSLTWNTRVVKLADRAFDDLFTNLTGEPFVVESSHLRLEVSLGPEYSAAQIYAPFNDPYVCIEPFTVETNSWNRAGAPKKFIAPGTTWRESFTIRALVPAYS